MFAKVDEELAELRAELDVATPDPDRVESELGDLLFTLVNVARRTGVNPEDALRKQMIRFGQRFRFIETTTAREKREMTDLSAEEWFALWNDAKKHEKQEL